MVRIKAFGAIAIFLLLCAQLSFAGTTGKISGTVKDKESGDPLPGVNIILEGTNMGAASDINGNYTILHVPPGIYTPVYTMMGYSRVIISGVQVRIDQTAKVDVDLESEVITGEEVTVVAEKRVVKEDVSTSVASMSGNEIQELPMTNVSDVVGLQAGVEDGLVIRGGSADETLFRLDGITLRDPRNNQPITAISLSSIQELSVERGGFNAEYGQVRSGIINVVTKEGNIKGYSGSATFKYSPPQAKHFGISPYDANSMWMRPFLDPEVAFTGTTSGAWDSYTRAQYPKFDGWNIISQRLLADDDPTNDLSPAAAQQLWKWQHRRRPVTDQPDYNIDAGFGGPVPIIGKKLGNMRFYSSYRNEREMLLIPLSRNDYVDYNWSTQITSDITNSLKLKISGMTGKSNNVAINVTDNQFYGTGFGINASNYWNPTDYMRSSYQIAQITNEQRPGRIFVDSWYCNAVVAHDMLAAKITHMLNPSTFYEASVEYISRTYNTEPGRERDLTKKYEIVPGYYVDEAPFGFSPEATTGIDGMFFGGHTSTTRDFTKSHSTAFKFDMTSQVNYNNMVKTGAEFIYNDLKLLYGEVNNFTGSKNIVNMHKFPVIGSFYIQDKLETNGFILNAGIRMDYSNSNTNWINLGYFDKTYFSSKYDSTASYTNDKAEARVSWSPRLGISHPITENSKLFFNYGHFQQLPTYEQIFRLGRGISGQVNNIGNPNLLLAKTVSYELGYDHAIHKDYLLQFAAYYNDITDQQDFTNYISADATINYNLATNNSYEDIRGFEMTLKKSAGRWWTGFANYTYQVRTGGHFGTAFVYQDPSEQRKYDMLTSNLYQERPIPQPYARTSITFSTPDDFGPSLAGIRYLNAWSANIIADWQAGGYTTWNENQLKSISQNVQLKDYYNLVLRLNKTFTIKKTRFIAFIEIENLLDTKRLSGVSFYDATDQIAYFQSLQLPYSNAYNNIIGDDKAGDYRDDDVEFQPIKAIGTLEGETNPDPSVIYYNKQSKQYMNYIDGNWSQVNSGKMDQILKDKAYIDMPNQTSFNFLNPRQVFFGIRMSFDLN